ncbi:MAG: DUF2029 domain-containing protein, partial [Oscillochloris sp.]|nr:DUF2029 domain-containing protein [Oscillochloris sp.]
MTVLARPEPLPRLVLVDLSVALLAGLMLALALWLPAAPPPFSRIYQNLHTPETSAIGTYAWSYPEFSLYLPLARAGRAALVHQRMAAGATPSDTRPIMVNAGDFRLRFMVRGGTPLRTYHYLLPTHSPVLNAWFQVAPLDYENPSDRRALGVVLADTQVQILGGSGLPGPAALALLALPVPLLLAGWGLGLGAWRRPALLLIALSVALFFRADPSAVLPLTLPLNGGLLVVAALGALCRRLLAAVGPGNASSGSLLLWGLAAVIGPWTYIGAGLWRNLGRQWAGQALLVELLLGLPVLAVALYLWLPALRRQSALLAGLALAGVLSWGLLNLRFELSNVATDFSAYYYGARRMLNGEPLYELARLREGPFAITYKYHPFFLTFVLPVMLFPLDVAIAAWRGAGLIWIVAAIAIIIAAQPVDLRRRLALIGLVIATNLAPIGQTLRLGQADPLILIGVVLGVALMRRYSWLSAAIWGMLGVIKIYPL